jgi:hypothetical protein
MDIKEYAQHLDELESKLDRLRALYEQYFQGLERLEPTIPRKDIERRVQALRRVQVRNTAMRFRFQQLLQKYTTYVTYWGRVARQIEEGTFRRDVLRARKKRDQARKLRAEEREGYEQYEIGTEDYEVLPEEPPSWDDLSEVTKTNPYRPAKGEKPPASEDPKSLPRPPLVPLMHRSLSDREIEDALSILDARDPRSSSSRGHKTSSKAVPPKPPPTVTSRVPQTKSTPKSRRPPPSPSPASRVVDASVGGAAGGTAGGTGVSAHAKPPATPPAKPSAKPSAKPPAVSSPKPPDTPRVPPVAAAPQPKTAAGMAPRRAVGGVAANPFKPKPKS